jgi:DNA invertase Pin-like site-specific DNA recombinase
MSESTKISSTHLARCAFVYVRQSSSAQVEHNRESTDRQYRLVDRAIALGWRRDQVSIIDKDLGISGSGLAERSGFAHMTAEVALGRVGIVLGLEVSRLARNNADWYRLLDLCGATDTLIGDGDGIYHPGLFNDRLVLGLKGTMSEAELHVLRARLNGGIRNKAERGQLRRGLPIGLVFGEADGEILLDPDEAVRGAIQTVFDRFAEVGSARRVWLHFRSEALLFPSRQHGRADVRWVAPTYTKIHEVLTNPVYAGAYIYGKTKFERFVDDHGNVRKRIRNRAQSEWPVFLRDHHKGFIDWQTFEANQKRIKANTHPTPHQRQDQHGGAVREGAALLQGLARCGRCSRKLRVSYGGKFAAPAYHCAGNTIANGRAEYCMRVGGKQIDSAVARSFVAALAPAGLEAALLAAEHVDSDQDAVVAQIKLQLERARYEAQRAERRYRTVDPENRLVARGLEAEWEKCLRDLHSMEADLAQRQAEKSRALSIEERARILALGQDVERVWSAPSTTDRDRKELLRSLIEEVLVDVKREAENAHVVLRWRGGLLTELDVHLPRSRPSPIRTDEDTVELVRRLALHYSDAIIAGILNRQGKTTARGMRFTANRVSSLRTHWEIPCFKAPFEEESTGEIVAIDRAAEILGVAPSTVHRWLNDGFIAGEQLTPGAPWRIRITDELRARFVDETPPGYVAMLEATLALRVTRQTILQRVKRGELEAVHVRQGRRKGLRIKLPEAKGGLFDHLAADGGAV